MNIEPTKRDLGDLRLNQPTKKPAVKPRTSEQSSVFENIANSDIMGQLKDMPDIRPDVVELGKKLAEDPNYPSDDVLDQLSEVLYDEFSDI